MCLSDVRNEKYGQMRQKIGPLTDFEALRTAGMTSVSVREMCVRSGCVIVAHNCTVQYGFLRDCERLKFWFVLEVTIHRVIFLAGIHPVSEVVGAHDRCDPSHDATQKNGARTFDHRQFIDVRALHRTPVLLLTPCLNHQCVTPK